MAMFVSAKALAVIQFVALSFYRFEPAAILGQHGQGAVASSLVRIPARNEIEHFPGLRLGKRARLAVDVFGSTHGLTGSLPESSGVHAAAVPVRRIQRRSQHR